MANYIARIELHGGKEEDYEKLTAAIVSDLGYADFVLGRESMLIYRLPTGTYVLENSDLTLHAAHAIALEAAQATGFKFGLFLADWNLAEFDLEGETASVI